MKKINSQKGQALILIALAMVGLVGFTALTVDGGRVLSDRRHAQNAADTSVLAAALAKIQGKPDYKNYAVDRATSNGYTTGANGATVDVNLCSESGINCVGLPSGANTSEYIQVRITSIVSTTFARVVGRQTVTNVVTAIARAQGSSSSGSFFGGAGMVATKSGNSNQCFLLNGGAQVNMINTGVFINCSGSQAIFMNGGADLSMDTNGQVVGCYAYNGGATFDPITCSAPAQTIDANTFASVPKTLPPPTCSSNGTVSGNTYSPGNFSGLTINSTSTFNPGVYCVSGSFNINGQATINGPTGTVQFVLGNTSLNMSASPNTFNDVEFYTNNGNVTLNANGTLDANRLRFFSTGTGNFNANSANATLTSGNAYMYFNGGNLTWNGNTQIDLKAPPQGDPFGGLLIQMPWSNTNSVIFNGGSNVKLQGTILVPHSDVTFNGGSGFVLNGQVIGYTFIANGNSTQDITYVASQNYNPPNDPTIELTK